MVAAGGGVTALWAQEGGSPPEYYVHFKNGRVLRAVNTIPEGVWTLVAINLRNQFEVPTETIERIEPIAPETTGPALSSANIVNGQPIPPGGALDERLPPYYEPSSFLAPPGVNPQAPNLREAVQGVPNVNFAPEAAPFIPPAVAPQVNVPSGPTLNPTERRNLFQMRNNIQFDEGKAPLAPVKPN